MGYWNLWTPNTRIERQLLTLSVLRFLFILPRCQVIFQWNQTKENSGMPLVREGIFS